MKFYRRFDNWLLRIFGRWITGANIDFDREVTLRGTATRKVNFGGKWLGFETEYTQQKVDSAGNPLTSQEMAAYNRRQIKAVE